MNFNIIYQIAAKKNQMEIANSLLAFRADPNSESRAGFTPLHVYI